MPGRAAGPLISVLRRFQHTPAFVNSPAIVAPCLPCLHDFGRTVERSSVGRGSFDSPLSLLPECPASPLPPDNDLFTPLPLHRHSLRQNARHEGFFRFGSEISPAFLKPPGFPVLSLKDQFVGDSASSIRSQPLLAAHRLPATCPSAGGFDEPLQLSSVKKKRRLKMNKHKQRKLRRRERHRNK